MREPGVNSVTASMRAMAAKTALTRPLGFVDGACESDALLRHHILAPIKAALMPRTQWRDIDRTEAPAPGALRISLFPGVPGDVLLMFDLADRNHFRQFADDGRPFAAGFRKILVPGDWLRRQVISDGALQVTDAQVVAVGAPRIDHLRALMAQQPAKPAEAPLTVLFAPLHDNWFDRNGQPMSVAPDMEPYLPFLRAGLDLREAADGRNKDYKRPVTQDLLDADIVITDYTSLMYEAWALGKPVIFPRWLCGDRILEKSPTCAEAHVYRERIGHHADSFEALLDLLDMGRDLDLGPGVAAFMADYLSNWPAESRAAPGVARLLERLANPELDRRERRLRSEMEAAIKARNWAEAEPLIVELLETNPSEPGLYDHYARAMNGQGKWWQELDALETLITLRKPTVGQMTRLGDVRLRMNRPRAAAEAFGTAISMAPAKATADLHYKHALALEMPGHDGPPDPRRASEVYRHAGTIDPANPVAKVGPGALHAKAGRWIEAQAAYRAALVDDPLNADLWQRLGMAHDRCYEWEQAALAYRRALALAPTKGAWHYRLGFVLERQGAFDEAAAAYLHALRLSKTHQPDWHYRAGFVLEKAGRLAEACEQFLRVQPGAVVAGASDPYLEQFRAEQTRMIRARIEQTPDDDALWIEYSKLLEQAGDLRGAAKATAEAVVRAQKPNAAHAKRQSALEAGLRKMAMLQSRLSHDCTRPAEWLKLAELLAADGQIDAAIEAAEQAVLRSNDHMPAWHHRLGRLLLQAGRLPEACAAFRDQRILQRPHGAYEDKFATSDDLREVATYREFFDLLPIMPRTILYESFGGEGCSDNPLAIFTHVRKDPRFAGWRHFWVVDDMSKAPPALRNQRDVIFVLKETLLYQRLLCSVEFLVNNATFPFYYVRKEGQEFLATWHGTPLKTLGYDIEATPLQRANTARNLIQASMFIAPNQHTESVMLDRYGVRNLFTGRSLLTGYPRIDMLVNADEAEKTRIRTRLGLDPSKPVVLFAPTYRGHWATPELEAQSLADTIERMKSPDYNLVFRGHYFAERFIMDMDLPVTIAPHAIDTCSLLSIVDVLVTDYSSIFYDFLITKRPVIHFVPDWDYYVETRGVYFGKSQLPGIVCETEDHLISVLADCLKDPVGAISAQYLDDLARYCALEDGKATERVVEALFFDRTPPIQPVHPEGTKHILIHGGDLGDGPQLAALQSLLAATREAGHVSTLVVDRRVIINDAGRTANAQALLGLTDVLIRFGKACFSLEEAWVNDRVRAQGHTVSPAMQAVFDASVRHEVRRLFGHARFDAVLEFDAHRPFWCQVLAHVPAGTRMIRLPGAPLAEQVRAEPGLKGVMATLPGFDRLLSESATLDTANRAALAGPALPEGRFAVLPACPAEALIDTRLAADLPAPAAQAWLAAPAPRLLGLPGTDAAAAERMLLALGALRAAGTPAHLGLVAPAGSAVALRRAARAQRLADHVTILADTADPLPLMQAAALVLLAPEAEFAAHLAAEARHLGLACHELGDDDATQIAGLLSGKAKRPRPSAADRKRATKALAALFAGPGA